MGTVVMIGREIIAAPPTVCYVNKYTLGMRRSNNGGLPLLSGLLMPEFVLYYL